MQHIGEVKRKKLKIAEGTRRCLEVRFEKTVYIVEIGLLRLHQIVKAVIQADARKVLL